MKLLIPTGRFLAFIPFLISVGPTQQPAQPGTAQHAIRVQTSLVLVDVITQDYKTGLPVRDFKKKDFRMFDSNHEVAITSFHAGAHYDTRPIVLWFVVICNERGKVGGSAEFVGNVGMFRSALDQLDKSDTVGVAHWCDNGEARLDLLPTRDSDSIINMLAETIRPISFQVGGASLHDTDQVGEDSFRRLIRLVIQDTLRRNPQPLPVIVFLDGDHTGQPLWKLDKVIDDFLETSGIVFGIKDSRAPQVPILTNGEVTEIEHYMADQTGGQFFSAHPSGYAVALEEILMQLHFRYELGFVPPAIDGKRHSIKVDLTKGAEDSHKGVRLRYRSEYIPERETPAWAQ